MNLLDDLSRDRIVDESNKKRKQDLEKRIKRLYSLIGHDIKNDENNQLLDPSNTHRVRDLYHYHHHQHFFPYLQIYHLLIYPILFFLFLFLLYDQMDSLIYLVIYYYYLHQFLFQSLHIYQIYLHLIYLGTGLFFL